MIATINGSPLRDKEGEMMDDKELDILGLSETKCKNNGQRKIHEDYEMREKQNSYLQMRNKEVARTDIYFFNLRSSFFNVLSLCLHRERLMLEAKHRNYVT